MTSRSWMWALLCWAAVGCGGAGLSQSGSAGTVLRRVAGPGTAQRYETHVPSGVALHDDARQTLAAVLSGAPDSSHLQADPRLGELARWVGQWTELDGAAPGQSALDDAARELGLVEPTPHILVIGANDAVEAGARLQHDLQGLLAQHAYTHIGGAVVPRGEVDIFVLCLAFRFVELQPVPRTIEQGSPITLDGALPSGFRQPAWALTLPDGQVRRGDAATTQRFHFQLPTQSRGVYRVELLAQAELGVVVIANFPVYVGQTPPSDVALYKPQASGSESAGEAAKHMLALINEERSQAHLPALRLDDALSHVAAAHNADMLEHNFIGHTSKSTGDAANRVARAGIRTGLVLENIGRGYSTPEVHAGLMQSPGHRGNLLSPLATNVGIAVSIQPEDGHDAYLVTEVFTRVTPKLPSDAKAQLLKAIDERRRSELQETDVLTKPAENAIQHCFENDGEKAVIAALRKSLPAGMPVAVVLSIASSLEELAQVEALKEPANKVGIALIQGERANTAPNSICALILLSD